jgi:hypothetical protein
MSSHYCLKCNRPLSDPASINHGYGPKCWTRIKRTLHLEEGRDPDPVTISDHKLARDSRAELLRRLLGYSYVKTCHCGTPLVECDLMTCDHVSGGLPLAGYAVPQWVWFECPVCRYQLAWWKLRPHISLDDLAPQEGPDHDL